MSYDLNLASALPVQPLVLAAPVLLIVVVLGFIVIRKGRATKAGAAAWKVASEELGIKLIATPSTVGLRAQGRVNRHVVAFTTENEGGKRSFNTQYSIKFEAPEAPRFKLTHRSDASMPILDTGNPKFDAVVAVETSQPVLLGRYLTAGRRAAILRLLSHWPDAEITNREAHLRTPGIESDASKLVDSICHLVASAEAFDQPTRAARNLVAPAQAPVSASETVGHEGDDPHADAHPLAVPATLQQIVNGDSDVLTEVRLDEITVLKDLFNAGLSEADIAGRFQQVYRGRDVAWSGEVLRVSAAEEDGHQRIAALIGSVNDGNPESGRVVAFASVPSEPAVTEGDVVAITGSLANLNPGQRLFQIK